MNRDKNIEALNTLDENGFLPLLLGELISSDTLESADQCRKSIEMLSEFVEALPETNIKDKEKWKKMMEEGLEIARRDLKYFEEKED